MKTHYILVINPGSTTTKLSIFKNEKEIIHEEINHKHTLDKYHKVQRQEKLRYEVILKFIEKNKKKFNPEKLTCVAGRGGPIRPMESGVYKINKRMLHDLRYRPQVNHASLLGGLLAKDFADRYKVPCFIIDPVSVDEMIPEAKISGSPLIQRKSMSHALNIKAIGRVAAKKLGKKYEKINMVIAHMGGGISVTAHRRGRMIDVNNALEMGPFSPERAGELPILQLVDLCYDRKFTRDGIKNYLEKKCGLRGYLGTNNVLRVIDMIKKGNNKAELILNAMIYQIVKEIGGMVAVLEGKVDAIVLTGNIAYNKMIINMIRKKVGRLAKVIALGGQKEMESLALGALRVLRGKEKAKVY